LGGFAAFFMEVSMEKVTIERMTDRPFGAAGVRKFRLPEISPDERIQYHGQKFRKHNTKRRRNKLHDKWQ
jgi:hypothetical protein